MNRKDFPEHLAQLQADRITDYVLNHGQANFKKAIARQLSYDPATSYLAKIFAFTDALVWRKGRNWRTPALIISPGRFNQFYIHTIKINQKNAEQLKRINT